MSKRKIKLTLEEDEVVIIDVQHLPHTGTAGVWYHLLSDDNYYYWDGSSFVNAGGDRPTHPPVNP